MDAAPLTRIVGVDGFPNKRHLHMNRGFEAMDRRFEAVIEELRRQGSQLREMNVHLSALGGRVGYGLEDMVRGVVEEFAGHSFPTAERLVLRDEAGDLFGGQRCRGRI